MIEKVAALRYVLASAAIGMVAVVALLGVHRHPQAMTSEPAPYEICAEPPDASSAAVIPSYVPAAPVFRDK
jgi:hypothetical protein